MDAHVYVIDASLKRTQVKVTRDTPLRRVLEAACTKFGLDPDQHVLKHNEKDKPLDLSLPFKFANLVSGAKLQLVRSSRSPSVVSVALKLPETDDNLRLQDKFATNTPLWLILRKFEDGVAGSTTKLNLTERSAPSSESGSGYLCYLQPCLNIMGQSHSTFPELQKTLGQLGYNSGNVLIYLEFKNNRVRMEEAKAQISTYLEALAPKSTRAEDAGAAHGAHAEPDVQLASLPDASADNSQAPQEEGAAAQDPSEDTVMTPAPPEDTSAQQPTQQDDVIASSSGTKMPSTESQFPSLNPGITVYSAPAVDTPAAAREAYNEADYHPTVEHAQIHQAGLTTLGQNKRLQSDKELEAAKASRKASLAEVKSVTLRVELPDQMRFDMPVEQIDTAKSLYSKVRDTLADPSLDFSLRVPGPRGLPVPLDPNSDKKIISDLAINSRSLIRMMWDDSVDPGARKGPVLKQELRGQAQELKVQSHRLDEDNEDNKAAVPKQEESKKRSTKGGDVEAKMKRLLGFGKKK